VWGGREEEAGNREEKERGKTREREGGEGRRSIKHSPSTPPI